MTDTAALEGRREAWPVSQTVTVGATIGVLGTAIYGLAAFHAVWAAAAMAVVVLAAATILVLVLGWSVGLAVLLIVTCLIDRNTFPVGALNIRPEQVAAMIVVVGLVVYAVRTKRSLPPIRPDRIELLLLAWFALGLVSSIIAATNRVASLKILALLILSSLALFLPRRLIFDEPQKIERVVRWALLAVALESAFAALMYFIHVFGPTIAMSLNSATGHLNAYGTLWEPNALGAIAGAGAVAWIFLGPRFFKSSWVGASICLTASAASFARAAWLAVILLVALSLATRVRRRIDLRALGFAALGASVLVAWIFASDRLGNYSVKGITTSVRNGTDILGRLYQFGPALADLKRQPIIGGGIDSYGQQHTQHGLPEHLGNLELLVLHDTGALGLILFAAFAATIIVVAWRNRDNPIVFGLAAANVVILITNQATEGLELMITWLMVGLLVAATDAAKLISPTASARTARYTGS